MKTLLHYLLFFVTAVAGAQTVTIPDANFKAKLLSATTANGVARNSSGTIIVVDANGDGEIQQSEALQVYQLYVNAASIEDLTGIAGFSNLRVLECQYNQLHALDVSALYSLQNLYCYNNQLTDLNIATNTSLKYVFYYQNPLGDIDFSNLANLIAFDCSNTNVITLNLSSCPALSYFSAGNNAFLSSINLRNGTVLPNFVDTYFGNCPNLAFICADDAEVAAVQQAVDSYSTGTVITTDCSSIPAADYNTITGAITFDTDNNGCDAADVPQSFIKIKIYDGTSDSYTFTDAAGNYTFYTQACTFTVTPQFEEAQYFIPSPALATVTFPVVDNSVATENFCIAPNGISPDVEVVMVPVTAARPGFDAIYKIAYKNKGNQVITVGSVSCLWEQSILTPVSMVPMASYVGTGTYSWNYASTQPLLPFENREILMTLNVNSPTDVPPVNSGDIIPFTATINSYPLDIATADNSSLLDQLVVNAADPNNIVCIEGDAEPTTSIGKYLHYVINFENVGTASAETVTITQEIDPTDFDISTLQLINSSHPVNAKIVGNTVTFAFPQAALGVAAHGNILFKLKSKNNLMAGDSVMNQASITFDFNEAIVTNQANTLFGTLGTGNLEIDNAVKLYPNPAKGIVTLKANSTIRLIQLYDVQGRLLQAGAANDTSATIDVSSRAAGIYLIKITTDNGIATEKLVKE